MTTLKNALQAVVESKPGYSLEVHELACALGDTLVPIIIEEATKDALSGRTYSIITVHSEQILAKLTEATRRVYYDTPKYRLVDTLVRYRLETHPYVGSCIADIEYDGWADNISVKLNWSK